VRVNLFIEGFLGKYAVIKGVRHVLGFPVVVQQIQSIFGPEEEVWL
jgi:hypothetical protein